MAPIVECNIKLMPYSLILLLATVAYLLATLSAFRMAGDKNENRFNTSFIFAGVACLLHLLYAYDVSAISDGLNFSLSSMSVLVSAIVVSIFLLACFKMPIKRLGILVYPLTILSLVFSYVWNSTPYDLINSIGHSSRAFTAHILVSIFSYALLTISTIQALLYAYQEKQLKKRTAPALLMALPPLQTMEQLLFRLVATGFILLTLTLLSGAFFSQEIFGQPFEFKHHTVLAIMGWFVFAILLFKRFTSGLRGSHAVVWTIVGFLLIQLGYFGTKFISESLNIQ